MFYSSSRDVALLGVVSVVATPVRIQSRRVAKGRSLGARNMADSPAPRVFMSHASEDKDRFVLPFAEKLRASGVDAWVDLWEMTPGDSLVKKIFTEGIGQADAVIVVLSKASVVKPWVMEELDAAVVRRISTDSKLIPVMLDGLDIKTEVPVAIRHLVIEDASDATRMPQVVERVLRSIFGSVERPPLGPPPIYAEALAHRLPTLDRIDTQVFAAVGARVVAHGSTTLDSAAVVAETTETLCISTEQAIESVEVLGTEGYLDVHRTLGRGLDGMTRFTVTTYGLGVYLRTYVGQFDAYQQSIFARIAERPDGGTERELANSSEVPRAIIHQLLEELANQGDLRLSRPLGPTGLRYHQVSPRLRRKLGN